MKTKIKKDFDAVKFMREKRDKISKDIADMDYKQIKEYFARKKERASMKRIIRSDRKIMVLLFFNLLINLFLSNIISGFNPF